MSDPNVNDAIEPVESVEDELDTVEGADSEDTEASPEVEAADAVADDAAEAESRGR